MEKEARYAELDESMASAFLFDVNTKEK
uniref:Predicted protein n=1 Tax=Hordeum vulgare subsp. vulgare TaxID=112509 RepID=F2EKX3_HORVV|nr:predicted protein [Hordeum vulgare subsp. vulgare]